MKPLYRRGGDHFDTGQPRIEIERLMDAETFMGAAQAVESRFAGAVGDGVDGQYSGRGRCGHEITTAWCAVDARAGNDENGDPNIVNQVKSPPLNPDGKPARWK